MSNTSQINVQAQAFGSLLESGLPLALDSYQRGFVWEPDKVMQLSADLHDYATSKDGTLPYYMGTVLLHRDTSRSQRFIIDGQQRITALSLLYLHSTGMLPAGQQLTYSSQSARCVREAMQALSAHDRLPADVIDGLMLTVIEVDDADLAFTFFDTQNNRGVRLEATDLLKAYHLRAIDQDPGGEPSHKLALEQRCAERWEALQRSPTILSTGQDFAPNLFNRFLWRARRWRGSRTPPAKHAALLAEFETETWTHGDDARSRIDTVPVYACRHNQLAASMTLTGTGGQMLQGNQIHLHHEPASLPMALRQPIHRGIGFFLYADKYADLLQTLINKPCPCETVRAFREIDEKLVKNNQAYLREVFLLCSLVYVDQFEFEKLPEFALRLEFLLGALRLDKKQIKRETAANFLGQTDLNLLDVIAQSYHPKQVLDFLKQRQRAVAQTYAREELVATQRGVQGRYRQAVLDYFNARTETESTSLADKSAWVEKMLNDRQGACAGV